MIRDLVLKNRSIRRFYEHEPVPMATLRELIDLARLSASAANRQPLKYILSNEPEKNALILPHLSWAGYLTDWDGPEKGERPSAYIVILADTEISAQYWCDHGIASQSILLGAVEREFGGCIFGAIDHDALRKDLKIPIQYEILLVIALGKPKEKVALETVGPDGDIKYWRDDNQVHHVPKRTLDEIIIG